MKSRKNAPVATTAILALVEIKRIIEGFEAGEINLFVALDAIAMTARVCEDDRARRRPAA